MRFTLTGCLSECVLLAYRAPVEIIQPLLPRGLGPLTRGPWAFWNIVACRVQAIRPRGLPRWLGLTYCHVAYRLYVRASVRPREGSAAWVEGLYFVHSDADNRVIVALGNLLSDFRFHPSTIDLQSSDQAVQLQVRPAAGGPGVEALSAELQAEVSTDPALAPGSCFKGWGEAAQFLKYRPLGLSVNERRRRLKLAEVIREEADWRETPLRVTRARWAFLERLCVGEFHLEAATRVAPLDYHWRLGGSSMLF